MSALVGGAVIAERMFGFPDLGLLLTERVPARDIPTVADIVDLITCRLGGAFPTGRICGHASGWGADARRMPLGMMI